MVGGRCLVQQIKYFVHNGQSILYIVMKKLSGKI